MHTGKIAQSVIATIAITYWTSNCLAADTPTAAMMAAAIKSASWGKNVTLSFGKDTWTLVSDGVPNHPRPARYLIPKPGVMVPESAADLVAGDDPTRPQHFEFNLPLQPRMAPAAVTSGLGPIGILVSGAALFNPYEADDHTIALQHNITVNGVSFVDACNGHATPADFVPPGTYHYHGVPHCITDAFDRPGQHSALIGIALDGFPIFGPHGKDGQQPVQLDTCNGHTEPTGEFPQGGLPLSPDRGFTLQHSLPDRDDRRGWSRQPAKPG